VGHAPISSAPMSQFDLPGADNSDAARVGIDV